MRSVAKVLVENRSERVKIVAIDQGTEDTVAVHLVSEKSFLDLTLEVASMAMADAQVSQAHDAEVSNLKILFESF